MDANNIIQDISLQSIFRGPQNIACTDSLPHRLTRQLTSVDHHWPEPFILHFAEDLGIIYVPVSILAEFTVVHVKVTIYH